MSQLALECRVSCPFNYGCGEQFRYNQQPCVSVIGEIAETIKIDKKKKVALFTDGSAVGNGVKICIPKYINSSPYDYSHWNLLAVAYNGYLEYRGSKTDNFAYPSI